MKVIFGLFLFSFISCSCAVNVSQCHDAEKPFDGLSQRVKLGNCRKIPCRIRKNTKNTVQMRVTPAKFLEIISKIEIVLWEERFLYNLAQNRERTKLAEELKNQKKKSNKMP